MKSATQSALEEALRRQIHGDSAPEASAAPVVPAIDESKLTPVDTTGKKSFTEIIGKTHPTGEYYFTVYAASDWDKEVQEFIPEVNAAFTEFDLDYALSILMAIEFDKPMLAYGPPGTGKSVTPEQVCARIGYPYYFIQGMGGTEPSDYVGSPWVEDGSMSWKDGPMSFAVRHGMFLLYDEPFKASAQTNMCIQSLLDSRRELKLYGHPDPVKSGLKAHPKFRIGLADNVRGTGDNMHKYAAEVQDQSTLNRCSLKVKVNYPKQDVEKKIIKGVAPALSDNMVDKMVKVAAKIRNGWNKDAISLPFTLRDTQEWAKQTEFLKDPKLALQFCYLNGMDKDTQEGEAESKAVQDILSTVGL